MPLLRDLSTAQIAFQVEGESPDHFLVVRFRGAEGLCQLYRFEIDLVCFEENLDFESYVGKACVLSVETGHGTRWFHGIVGRLEHTNENVGQCFYRADVMPAVWTLTHRYGSRIFQNKSVPQIIEKVLQDAGIDSDRVRIGPFQEKHPLREYCVQYRETDYNFVCRLMEEEGIWWYFEQEKGQHVFVLADSPSGYKPIPGDATLRYQPPTGMHVETEHVFRFRRGRTMRPGSVVLRDFSFENPTLDLESRHDQGRDTGLEFSDYPGEYADQGLGADMARLRTEEFEVGRTLAIGQSNCSRLGPARTFHLAEHPSEKLNGAYLLTTVTHQGKQAPTRTMAHMNGRSMALDGRVHQSLIAARQSDNGNVRELAEALLQIAARFKQGDATAHRALANWIFHAGQVSRDLSAIAGALGAHPQAALTICNLLDDPGGAGSLDGDASVYECRFECIPAKVPYRPSRVTPWPVMRGSQTARVVGPKGEEIYTDAYGRVKVQFNWDREGRFNESSSCWIRVSQGAAGGQYGMMFLPRVGQEVIVDFLEGDPDRPIITGRVYNADQMPPYALPGEKTKSVIKTHSSKGGGGTNEIRFEDLKDKEQLLFYAQRDLHLRANRDRVANVDHDDHLTVGSTRNELVKKHRNSQVTLDCSEKIGGKKSLAVTGDVAEEFKSNHSEYVGQIYYVKAGRKVVIEGGEELTLKVGGNFLKIDSQGITLLGTEIKLNTGGSAGTATLIALKDPESPAEADKAAPGKDVVYDGGSSLTPGAVAADVEGRAQTPAEEKDKKTSWIEIELVDEEGRPVPNEEYEITAPDGKTIKRGKLDEQGQAHVDVEEPGNCEISFPRLDGAAWARGSGAPAHAVGGAEATETGVLPGYQMNADVQDADVDNEDGATDSQEDCGPGPGNGSRVGD